MGIFRKRIILRKTLRRSQAKEKEKKVCPVQLCGVIFVKNPIIPRIDAGRRKYVTYAREKAILLRIDSLAYVTNM